MKTLNGLLFLLCVLSQLLCGNFSFAAIDANIEKQLNEANEAYASGRFDEAIGKYRYIIGTHGFSPELLHNLGNSYVGNGQYGQAILQYLRGLSIVPGDDDLKGSLEMTREKSGLFKQEESLKYLFFNLYDMNQWALLALIAYIALTLLFLVNLRFPIKKGFYTGCFLIAAFICICMVGAYQQQTRWASAVVVKPDSRLLMSPFPTALSQGILDEGALVFSENKHGNYHYIRDEKGRSGWVESTAFEHIQSSHITYSQSNVEQ